MDEATISIRPMRPDEVLAVVGLVARSFWLSVAPLYSPQGTAEFLAYANAESMLRRLEEDHFVLVALQTGQVVGMVEVRHHEHISLLFVEPSHQRQGIGRALLSQALQAMRESRPDLVEITVNSSPNSVEAYTHFGFIPTAPLQEKNGIRFVPMTLKL
jgi:ribosomal protein S18 acetylase RimI-like enzyme